jgi:hypothetical protein
MMKRFVGFAASLMLIGSTSLVLAQDSTPAATPDASTPAAATPAPAGNHGKRVMSPEMKEIHDRIKLQEDRIAAGVKNGKLTSDEAAALTAKLKSIREELRADFKQNKESGQKGLTDDQKAQINGELDANSAAIHDIKQDAAEASTPANP